MYKKKIGILIFVATFISIASYMIYSEIYGDKRTKKLNDFLENKQKIKLKKYLIPYQFIFKQEKQISQQKDLITKLTPYLSQLELYKKEIGTDIKTTTSNINLSDNNILKKYKLDTGFYAGINNIFPGSGYIDFYGNDIFILSSRGVLVFRDSSINNEANFKQIKNNIEKYIGLDQFKKSNGISIKDLLIFRNKIYVSYTHEIKKDCWNTSLIFGDINYSNIVFKELFSSPECIHSTKNLDKEFEILQSGGKVIPFDENNVLMTIGDYRSRYLSQDKESINGKIIQINIKDGNYKIISMGHRNPQGLFFDKKNNFLLETEHGPMGGDEINLIKMDQISQNNIQNFGWPISSVGEHYGGISEKRNKIKYQKYPLYSSHIDHGFIEPLKSFVPSIGISEIVGIGKKKFVVSSLKDKSLYFFQLSQNNKIVELDKVKVFERIRDLQFQDNNLYLFLEDSASLGIIKID